MSEGSPKVTTPPPIPTNSVGPDVASPKFNVSAGHLSGGEESGIFSPRAGNKSPFGVVAGGLATNETPGDLLSPRSKPTDQVGAYKKAALDEMLDKIVGELQTTKPRDELDHSDTGTLADAASPKNTKGGR